MNMFLQNKITVLVLAVLFSLAGCGNMVKVDVKSDKDLNNVGSGSPLPVVVRIYQLSEDTAFKSAGFRDLWKRDAEILGSALLSSKEIVMQPGSSQKVSFPLEGKTKFVAVFAAFRNSDAAKWNAIQAVSDNIIASSWHKLFPVSISLHLGQNKIEIVN